MSFHTDVRVLSDKAILKEIAASIKRARLNRNKTQQDLSVMSGLNRYSITRLERGEPVSFLTLIQVLRALNILDRLNSLMPKEEISPILLAKSEGKLPVRASKKRMKK